MTSVVIDKQYMPHSEGTKFYQVLRVLNKANRKAVTFTHWGKQIGAAEPVRIISRGEHTSFNTDCYTEKIRAKTSRGYETPIHFGTTQTFTAAQRKELENELVTELGRAETDKVLLHLGLTAKVEPTDESPAHAAAREAKVVVPEKPAAAAADDDWGTF